MNLSTLKPDERAAILEGPEEIFFLAVCDISSIYQEKHPFPTMEELAVLVAETLLHPRARRWIMRMGTYVSSLELKEIKKCLTELRKQKKILDADQGTGQRLPNRLQLCGEGYALRLRLASNPLNVRWRAKLLKARAGKCDTDKKAGRHRNNKKAASRLFARFQKKEQENLEGGRLPSQAYNNALDEAAMSLNLNPRVEDKQAVLRQFKRKLSSHSGR